MQSPCLLTLAIFGFFTSLLSSCWGYHDPKFQLSLETLQNDGITPDEINTWWKQTTINRSANYSRVFPICVIRNPGNNWPSHVSSFSSYFSSLDNITVYDPEIHAWKRAKKQIVEIEARTIKIHVLNAQDEEAKRPFPLRQWLSFTLRIKGPSLKGLYVQSIVGPLGIPAGEFSIDDLRCTIGVEDDPAAFPFAHVVPCHTPRATDVQPNALVFDSSKSGDVLPRRLHFKYRWSESQCQETGYFQFILISTTRFQSFETVLSPIYRFRELYSPSGLSTPYHSRYLGVTCNVVHMEPQTKLFTLTDGIRIIPSKEYDECVLNGVGMGKTDLDRFTCPPDYFTCNTDWTTNGDWELLIDKWWKTLVAKRSNFRDCCEIGPIKPPPTTTTTTTEKIATNYTTSTPIVPPFSTEDPISSTTEKLKHSWVLLQQQASFLKEKSKFAEKHSQISHGDLCIFTWLVIVPIANHVARFLKDFPDIKSLGLGIWIILHVALHSIGILLIWVSFGLVIGGGEDKLGNVSGRHFLLGILCTSLQHLQFVTGFNRNQNERASFYYVLTHSLSGYISHFFGYVAIFLSNATTERKWLSMAFFILWLLSLIASYLVEKKQESILGVVFHRAQCPILQRIMINNRERPPLMKVKIAILLFLCFAQGLLFAIVLLKYSAHTLTSAKFAKQAKKLTVFSSDPRLHHLHVVEDEG